MCPGQPTACPSACTPAISHKRRKVRRQFPASVSFEPTAVQNQRRSLMRGHASSASTTTDGSETYTGTPVFCVVDAQCRVRREQDEGPNAECVLLAGVAVPVDVPVAGGKQSGRLVLRKRRSSARP